MIRAAFLIPKLELGDAERQLTALAKVFDRRRFRPLVATFYQGGELEAELCSADIGIVCLDKRGRWDIVGFALRPHIVHAYQRLPNLFASATNPQAGRARVLWSVRDWQMNLAHYDYSRRAVATAARLASRFADLIIANAHAGRRSVLDRGYFADRVVVVPNSIDTELFRPNFDARSWLRNARNIALANMVIGLVKCLDPKKGHADFLPVASILAARDAGIRFLCVGLDEGEHARAMKQLAAELGISGRVTWAAARADITDAMNAPDVNTLASAFGEDFPNVIGEAVACLVFMPSAARRVKAPALSAEGAGQ